MMGLLGAGYADDDMVDESDTDVVGYLQVARAN